MASIASSPIAPAMPTAPPPAPVSVAPDAELQASADGFLTWADYAPLLAGPIVLAIGLWRKSTALTALGGIGTAWSVSRSSLFRN